LAAANTVAVSAVEPELLIALHSVERLELAVIGDLYICGDGTSDGRPQSRFQHFGRSGQFLCRFPKMNHRNFSLQMLRKILMGIWRRSALSIVECTVGHVTWQINSTPTTRSHRCPLHMVNAPRPCSCPRAILSASYSRSALSVSMVECSAL